MGNEDTGSEAWGGGGGGQVRTGEVPQKCVNK